MSSYRASLSTGTRSGGQSASAKHKYQNRQEVYLVGREGVRDDLVASGSGNLPAFADGDAGVFWIAVDSFERKNARLFVELQLNLPRELSLEQQKEAVESYMSELCDKEKLSYSWVIHHGKGENPHAHVMISETKNDAIDRPAEQHFKRFNRKYPERGGAQKSSALKPKQWLLDARGAWAMTANDALEKAGFKRHFDHRTLKEQRVSALLAKDWRKAAELDREVGEHEGWRVAALRRKHEVGELDVLPEYARKVIEKNDRIKELNAAHLSMVAGMSDAQLKRWEREAYFDALAEREPERFKAEIELLHSEALALNAEPELTLEEVVYKIKQIDLSIKNQRDKHAVYSIKAEHIKHDYQTLKRQQNALVAAEANQNVALKVLNKLLKGIGFKADSELIEPELERLSSAFNKAKYQRELAQTQLASLKNERDGLMQLDVSEPLREAVRLRRAANASAAEDYRFARKSLTAATVDKSFRYYAERDLEMIRQDLNSENYTVEDMQSVQQRLAELVDSIDDEVQKQAARQQHNQQPQSQPQPQDSQRPSGPRL